MLRNIALMSVALMSCVHAVPAPSTATDGLVARGSTSEVERVVGVILSARQLPIVDRSESEGRVNLAFKNRRATVYVNLSPTNEGTQVRLFASSFEHSHTKDFYVEVTRERLDEVLPTQAPTWLTEWKQDLASHRVSTRVHDGPEALQGLIIELEQQGVLVAQHTSR